ncbi:ABC transporter ATP-binding protein [Ruixingdingia sedimenti]|uniref:ABC transporter ATP-binding protein n=1 Tax=Ruixingdingia sedimenti TaxID=3073604 RepID=A0ABU1FB83_9RHOB|nr:ABC transporter ATP-binding protein [Xinfangfangia sp. LG-4]MDR5654151.1 ABC transporter ATP-binding protein [Xinfangfangia sp. LG-4]
MGDPGDRAFLEFDRVQKSYDQETLVVRNFDLSVAEGEFVTLLGPSGSGKSTLLMMLAGFESLTSGDIRLQGRSIARMAPYKRDIGMVFQNYALFPHMTIAENLGYPLKLRNMRGAEVRAKVQEYLDLVELGAYGNRRPAQLSGGQRQRVALARALIFAPRLVLMDEPLGALDKKLREQMQFEITRLHRQLGFTVIYVTHDQTEALTMSNRIAVFNAGVVQQCDAPDVLYESPRNGFVADFIGENNFLPGELVALGEGTADVRISSGEVLRCRRADAETIGMSCNVSVRPEKLFFAASGIAFDTRFTARFTTRLYVGDFIRYFFRLPDGTQIVVKLLNDLTAPEFTEGDEVVLAASTRDCSAFAAHAAIGE